MMASPRLLEASVLTAEHYEAWDRFVSSQEHTGSIYSTARYLDILCRTAGGSFSVAAIRDGESFVAGFGLYRWRAYGHEVITNRHLLYYNGVVLHDDLVAVDESRSRRLAVLDGLCRFVHRQPAAAVTLHCRHGYQDFRPFTERGWQASPSYTIVVPTADSAQLWGRFDRNARRLVRRAEDAGCTVATDNDVESLYRAHEEIHRRKGGPLYLPKSAFQHYAREVTAARLGVIFTARVADGAPAASQLVLLGPHRCSHTACAGSHERHLSTGAAYLLRWRAFVELQARGYAANDLTDATRGRVTTFKEQLGGTLTMNMALRWRRRASYRLVERGVEGYRSVRARAATLPGGR
jgi:hypothetical protein